MRNHQEAHPELCFLAPELSCLTQTKDICNILESSDVLNSGIKLKHSVSLVNFVSLLLHSLTNYATGTDLGGKQHDFLSPFLHRWHLKPDRLFQYKGPRGQRGCLCEHLVVCVSFGSLPPPIQPWVWEISNHKGRWHRHFFFFFFLRCSQDIIGNAIQSPVDSPSIDRIWHRSNQNVLSTTDSSFPPGDSNSFFFISDVTAPSVFLQG